MVNAAENQTPTSMLPSKLSLLLLSVLVSCVVLTCFLTFGSSPVPVTILILLLPSMFVFIFSKKKAILIEDTNPKCCPKTQSETEVGKNLNADMDTVNQCNGRGHSEACLVDEYQVESTEFPSDGESSDGFVASENFELGWMCSRNIGESKEMSESSCSDEDDEDDNLIEISLPKKNGVNINEESKQQLQSSLPDYFTESIFRQQGLVEILEEIEDVIEEDNLIEIDLSMGFIK
ncbi:hypothetical protein K2173_015509 [Erythroxylum novogranatense]|uniref:Transmembrane protein n=1 Tax=Erythroxylum novogranatense TaxID=1862640 RepID=A0AAV8SRW3_9ROSI|nr:hypothetical protein K2173_015509 [Erythroxylum novogranatense]